MSLPGPKPNLVRSVLALFWRLYLAPPPLVLFPSQGTRRLLQTSLTSSGFKPHNKHCATSSCAVTKVKARRDAPCPFTVLPLSWA